MSNLKEFNLEQRLKMAEGIEITDFRIRIKNQCDICNKKLDADDEFICNKYFGVNENEI